MVLQIGTFRVEEIRRLLTGLQHDKNDDGFLTKDEVIQLSESLLVSALYTGRDRCG